MTLTARVRKLVEQTPAEFAPVRSGPMPSIVTFAEQTLGLELRPAQREVLGAWEEQRPSVAVWCMGRRSTKTSMAAIIAIWTAVYEDLHAYLRPGEQRFIVTVATNERQARIALDMMRQLLVNSPALAPLMVGDTADELTLSNGVSLRAMPCSARGGRGLPISLLILDELGHFLTETEGPQAGDRVWAAMAPSVAQFAEQGHILALSSPNGRAGIFFDLFERAGSGKYADMQLIHRSTASMNPSIPAEWLAREQARDPDTYAVEYGAEFAASVATYLDASAIAECVLTGVRERPARSGVAYTFALDPAFTGDAFALIGACQIGETTHVDLARRWKGSRAKPVQLAATLAEVKELVLSYGKAQVVTDQYAAEAVVQGLGGLGIQVEYEPWTNESKASAFVALKGAINTEQIELLDYQPLLQELRALERRQTPGGKPKIGAPRGGHDDLATALAAAVAKLRFGPPPGASATVNAAPGGYHADRGAVLGRFAPRRRSLI